MLRKSWRLRHYEHVERKVAMSLVDIVTAYASGEYKVEAMTEQVAVLSRMRSHLWYMMFCFMAASWLIASFIISLREYFEDASLLLSFAALSTILIVALGNHVLQFTNVMYERITVVQITKHRPHKCRMRGGSRLPHSVRAALIAGQ